MTSRRGISIKGSIQEIDRKKGKVYRAFIDLPDDERKQKTKSFQEWKYDDPEAAARSWLISWNQKINTGEHIKNEELILREHIDTWHDRTKKHVSTATTKKRDVAINKHIKPYFDDIRLTDLTVYHIQRFYKEKLHEVSPSTVRIFHKVLQMVLNCAHRDELIRKNPIEHADPPEQNPPEMTVYDERQIKQFLKAIRDYEYEHRKQTLGLSMYPIFYTGLNTGMRIGEVLGMRWEDVDFDEQTISVRRSLKTKDGLYLGDPKTKSSERSILLTEENVDILKQHRRNYLELKMEADTWGDWPTVFVTSKGKAIWPSTIRRRLNKVLKKTMLPRITFHSLRHTHATMLLRAGVKAFSVAERLGHSSIQITMDRYTHYLPTIQKQAVDKYQTSMDF